MKNVDVPRVAYALGEIGDPAAVPVLIADLEDGTGPSGQALRKLGAPAARALVAIVVDPSMPVLIGLANRLAAEHVNVQTGDDQAVLAKLMHAGAVFLGPYSPVAAGDYVAGPSHCLPTNTTARFSSGISVYEFLKRGSVVRYAPEGLAKDADAIVALANAEHLDGHAASVAVRQKAEG